MPAIMYQLPSCTVSVKRAKERPGNLWARILEKTNSSGDLTKFIGKAGEALKWNGSKQFKQCAVPLTFLGLPASWDRLSGAHRKVFVDGRGSLKNKTEFVQNCASFAGMVGVSLSLVDVKVSSSAITTLFMTSDVAATSLNGRKVCELKEILKEAHSCNASAVVIESLESEKKQYLAKTAKSILSIISTIMGLVAKLAPILVGVGLAASICSTALSLHAAYLKETSQLEMKLL